MCCANYLLYGHNFKEQERKRVMDGVIVVKHIDSHTVINSMTMRSAYNESEMCYIYPVGI